ncbi:MAG: PKD domain-containing protein [Bacteroidia bacterium]|nr:PKD domain-containing protein [Bacteroidia bacterium]
MKQFVFISFLLLFYLLGYSHKDNTYIACPAFIGMTPEASEVCVNQDVSFTVITGCCQCPTTVTWNFGDGSNTAIVPLGVPITHSYTTSGSYIVTAIILNSPVCCYESMPTNLVRTVIVSTNSIACAQNLIYDPYACIGEPISFSATYLPDHTVQSVLWNFGDGTTSTDINPHHSFLVDGVYNITLTITYTNGEVYNVAGSQYLVSIAPASRCFGITVSCGNEITGCCPFEPVYFTSLLAGLGVNYSWDFGDPFAQGSCVVFNDPNPSYIYTAPGTYTVTVLIPAWGYSQTLTVNIIQSSNCPLPNNNCVDCISSFMPSPGKKYILSTWVSQETTAGVINFTQPKIILEFKDISDILIPPPIEFAPSLKSPVIDGWQKVEAEFTIPSTAFRMHISLKADGSEACYFDDIRIFPKDGNIKTFVYDPLSGKLMSILDENNYATLYEYDEDGNLIRIKKETERGIQTIQETKSNLKKP